MDMKKADFTIVSRPDHIRFECPYCQEDVEVDWNDVDVPEAWSDDFGSVECPNCNLDVKLEDWDYD